MRDARRRQAGEQRHVRFGLYLVREGIITAQQLVAALELQHARYVAIGQLAIEERLMSARDVFHVLHYQRRRPEPRERFGEIAVDMGFISQEELQRLLLMQMDRKPPLTDVLVRMGFLTADEVSQFMAAYHRELDRRKTITTQRLPAPHACCGKVPPAPRDAGLLDDAELFALMR
jgi:hypothetical protein